SELQWLRAKALYAVPGCKETAKSPVPMVVPLSARPTAPLPGAPLVRISQSMPISGGNMGNRVQLSSALLLLMLLTVKSNGAKQEIGPSSTLSKPISLLPWSEVAWNRITVPCVKGGGITLI